MKGTNLGEFEEMVLLIVGVQNSEAYGISIFEAIQQETERKVSVSTIHTTLYRLEDKGFVTSEVGGSSNERGGRSKRMYSITAEGKQALEAARDVRERLWNLLPS